MQHLGSESHECGSFYVRQFFGSSGSNVVNTLKGKSLSTELEKVVASLSLVSHHARLAKF